MKKQSRKSINLFDRKITMIVDENLNKLKGKILAPKKLADANKLLRTIKSLPK